LSIGERAARVQFDRVARGVLKIPSAPVLAIIVWLHAVPEKN
jgi:hypothetical protein